jgi:hypothetical protein
LAHLIQGLIAAGIFCSLTASGAQFSHRVHLKLKVGCVTCHTAVSTSTSANDNLLPRKDVSLSCHQEATVRDTPTRTMVAKFNHQLHLKLGNIAPVIAAAIDKGDYLSAPGGIRAQLNTKNQCEACHRGMEQSNAVSKANFPQMADCLVCHNQIELPFSCEKCHIPGPQLKPASHVAGFFDSHSSPNAKLDKQSCMVCHGRKFHCQGCH